MDPKKNEESSIVVSNDETSKIIKIGKKTQLQDFYQKILNVFPTSENMKLFYFEGYSHEKLFVSNEEEYIIGNKKGIEYFYFCSNNSNNENGNNNINYIDYLKYHSVIIFSPIKLLNLQEQNNERKKMQMKSLYINKSIKEKSKTNYNYDFIKNQMNQMGMNQMGMNQMGMNQMGMNPMNQMGMNPMNQMGMNPMNQLGMNPMNQM